MNLLAQNLHCLAQARELLAGLDDELYRRAPAGLPRGTVGAHLRHVLDAYQCLLDGWRAGRIDYDRRGRDPSLELDRHTALARLVALCDALASLADVDERTALSSRGDRAPDDDGSCTSSLGRELAFLASHSVHHFALIALTLHAAGHTPPEGFGVAPSTRRHWATQASRQP